MRSVSSILVMATVLTLSTALVPGFLPTGHAQGSRWSAILTGIDASYGNESWKYDPEYAQQGSPTTIAGHLQNQTASYAAAVGLRATLMVQACPVTNDGTCTDPLGSDNSSAYSLSAHVDTSRGRNSAMVKRAGDYTFQIDFDVDGANAGDLSGRTKVPPLDAGLQTVRVTINKRVLDTQSTQLVGDATLYFSYDRPFAATQVPAFAGRPHQQEVPDTVFRLYNDVGWDASVDMVTRSINGTTRVEFEHEYATNDPNETVELWSFIARKVAPQAGSQPAPVPTLPFIPGVTDNQTLRNALDASQRVVSIHGKNLRTLSASDMAPGRYTFGLTGDELLGTLDGQVPRALVVVATLLRPAAVSETVCPPPCKGGAAFRLGATEAVIPVSDRLVTVDDMELADPQQRPGPIREYAAGVNALTVYLKDHAGFQGPPPQARAGEVYALVPDQRSPQALSGASLSATRRADEDVLSANLAVRPIQDQGVNSYRLFGFVYAESDAFYGLATADRGYVLAVDAPATFVPPGEGVLTLIFESVTTDYEDPADDLDYSVRVFYQVEVPEAGVNKTGELTLPESGRHEATFAITSQQEIEMGVRVTTTSGDLLPPPHVLTMRFVPAETDKGLADRIPGIEAAFAAAAALFALVLLRRRLG